MTLHLSGLPTSALSSSTAPTRGRRPRRAAIAAALTMLALPAASLAAMPSADAAPAARPAPVKVFTDASRDVHRVTEDGNVSTPDPTRLVPDIRRTSVRLTRSTLALRVRFAAPVSGSSVAVLGGVKTPRRSFEFSSVRAGAVSSTELTRTNGGKVRCGGLSVRFVEGRRVAVVRIPAACIGKPSRVRVGFGVITDVLEQTSYADDAFSRTLGDKLGVSGPIRRS